MTTTTALTGPMLEVVALLAEGLSIPEIAAKAQTDNAGVNDRIWGACRALGAVDRTHLIALAYRAGLLRVPNRAAGWADQTEVDRLHAELEKAQRAVEHAEERADAQQARAETVHLQRVAQEDAEQAGRELGDAKRKHAIAQADANGLRSTVVAQAAAIEKLERELTNAKAAPPRKALAGDAAAQYAIGWALAQLDTLIQQNMAAARRGVVADYSLISRANALRDARIAISSKWAGSPATAARPDPQSYTSPGAAPHRQRR